MSKICFLGDIHIGARNASNVVCEHQLKFFENELFPYLKANKISTIVQLGDLFDNRKNSNHYILSEWKIRFFDYLEKNKINLITLIGNHDIFHRNNLKINATSLILGKYKNITIIEEPSEIMIGDTQFAVIPWVCDENREEVSKVLLTSISNYCLCHAEFKGFAMQKGIEGHGTEETHLYDKFDLVLSGHYHTRSHVNNILYTGIPFELTWADYDDQKGFHVFDEESHNFDFVKTRTQLFTKIEYVGNDTNLPSSDIITDCYVKLIVIDKGDSSKLESFISKLNNMNPIELKVIESDVNFSSDDNVETNIELKSTINLIQDFVNNNETTLDKNRLNMMLGELYVESQEMIE